MYKIILLALLLTGCAVQNNQPISASDRSLVEKAIVVSTLADDLHCSYIGFTVFNNKSNTYELSTKFNQQLSSSLSGQLNSIGIEATPLPRNAISFIDEEIGARNWANIKFTGSPEITNGASSILILDGQQQYNSTGGYYAKDNALRTEATLYVYDISSGKLIGKSSSYLSTPKRSFSCTQKKISESDSMLNLIDKSGMEVLKAIFSHLFGAEENPDKPSEPTTNALVN